MKINLYRYINRKVLNKKKKTTKKQQQKTNKKPPKKTKNITLHFNSL